MTLIYIFRLCLYIKLIKKIVAYHSFAMYIYSLNKYIRCSVFLFYERVTALYCSSRGFATWRELCKFPVDSQKFTDASTVSSDIFEDYKVYISSKLTFIIFFWFLYSSLGYFVVTAQGENIVKKVGNVISEVIFPPKYLLFNYVFYLHKPLWWLHCISCSLCSVVCDAASPPQTVKWNSQYRDYFFFHYAVIGLFSSLMS